MPSHPQFQNIKLPPTHHAVAAQHNISIVNVKYQSHFTSCKHLFCQLKTFVSLFKLAVYTIVIRQNSVLTYSSLEAITEACFMYQNATLQLMLATSYIESCCSLKCK
jgi:hypothetical protein